MHAWSPGFEAQTCLIKVGVEVHALKGRGRRIRNARSSSATWWVQRQPGPFKNLSQETKTHNHHHCYRHCHHHHPPPTTSNNNNKNTIINKKRKKRTDFLWPVVPPQWSLTLVTGRVLIFPFTLSVPFPGLTSFLSSLLSESLVKACTCTVSNALNKSTVTLSSGLPSTRNEGRKVGWYDPPL